MTKYEIIEQAILNKQQVFGVYSGKLRGLCPHVLGTKNGKEQCLFFQFYGSSVSGLPNGGQWRCLPLSGLKILNVEAGEWHTGTHGTKAQCCVDNIGTETPRI